MKIYTRTGDDGTTGLFGSGRVPKSNPRIETIGAVDETNAAVGIARAHLDPAERDLAEVLVAIQEDLFVLGADIATPPDARASVPRITAEHVASLERSIDRFQAGLEPLRYFVLPGGTRISSSLHLARCVCRRAERRLVDTMASAEVSSLGLQYLNRLSDLLFVLARSANQIAGIADTPWIPART